MTIRLIVSDLDGTLLNSDHVVSPWTEQVIRQARAQGVLFTVATGKTFSSTVGLIEQFDIEIPVICGNGTQVFAPNGDLRFVDPIPPEMALHALDMARTRQFTPVLYTETGLLAPAHDANVQELIDHHEPVPDFTPAIEQAIHNGHKPFKLVLMHQNAATVDAFQYELEQVFAGKAQVLRSGLASVVEVLPSAASKATALEFILQDVGLTWAETMCLGDSFNDLEMLNRAQIGVAMGNAPHPIRAGADYVTGTNDADGVGHAIKHFVLESSEVD